MLFSSESSGSHDPADHYWKGMLAGSRDSFRDLIKHFYNDLFRYGLKISSNKEITRDEIQELFLHLWLNRERLGKVRSIKAYLLVSFRRRLLHTLQRESKTGEFTGEGDNWCEFSDSHEELTIDKESHREKRIFLRTELSKLPARNREIIFLFYYQGLNANEIALVMDLKIQSVYNLLHETLKKLRNRIKG